jgi:hypothetical protein
VKTTSLGGTLGVTGVTTLSSNLTVSGTSTTSLGGTLGVTGVTTLSSNLTVSGTSTTSLGGTLGVTGITTLSSNLIVSGVKTTSLGGTLAVTGVTTLSSNLIVSGGYVTVGSSSALASSTYPLYVNGGTYVSGNTSLMGKIYAGTSAYNYLGSPTSSVYDGERIVLYNSGTVSTNLSLGVESAYMWFNVGSGDGYKFYSYASTTPRMMIAASTGYVGIGTTNPTTSLYVNGSSYHNGTTTLTSGVLIDYTGYLQFTSGGTFTVTWLIYGVGGTGYLGFYTGTGGLRAKLIDNNSTGGYQLNNFTGQHRCTLEDQSVDTNTSIGKIVVSNTSKYTTVLDTGDIDQGINAITINTSLPMVNLSTMPKQKSVFGVVSSEEDKETREDLYGNFGVIFTKIKGDRRVFINALGEGAIWVCDVNGGLESGDYICSSQICGFGMLQDDDILHNYTVAKITMNCDFNPQNANKQQIVKDATGEPVLNQFEYLVWEDALDETGNPIVQKQYLVKYCNAAGDWITEIDYTQQKGVNSAAEVYKCAFVGCTYHCG